MSERGVDNITEKFLGTGDLFALKFNEGLIFCEVSGWEQVKYAPLSQFSEVGPQSSTGFTRLEHDGDDILYTEKRKKKVKHVAIGHSPSMIRRYTNYPEDETRLRHLENVGGPSAGDDYGYIDGEDSPYGAPTDAEELYIPPGNHLNFNFYNPDNKAHAPLANIVMREYNIRPLDPSVSMNKNAIRRVVAPGSPMPIAPVGSVDRQARYDLNEFWGVDPISADRARTIGGGN